jgi:hypothetical protein
VKHQLPIHAPDGISRRAFVFPRRCNPSSRVWHKTGSSAIVPHEDAFAPGADGRAQQPSEPVLRLHLQRSRIPIGAGALYPITGTLLSPIIAGAAMSLSSVSVISNALRLRNLRLR